MPLYRYQNGDRPLEGFTIEHALGRGGFGEVYYAVSDAGRQVALKSVQNYEEIELRGIRECMNLKSPYLVTIFDVKHNDRQEPFVIMEYVAGPSLRQLLDEAPHGLGPTKAAFFVREIAKGLTYLHDCGIVHRDLKPHNVFFEDGFVKIGDYSLSKLISTSHRSGHTMTVGTVHYMAPEISRGRYDARVDIYALGVILYEMLTGEPPFTGDSLGEVLMKHVTAEPDLSRVEEPFRSAIAKALAKDPDARFQTARELVGAVLGAEHISSRVTAFDPQELSVVAARATRPALVGAGGGGSSGGNWSASPAQLAQTAAHVQRAEAVAPPRPGAFTSAFESAHVALGDACWRGAARMGIHPEKSAVDEIRAADPMPLHQRLKLAVAAAATIALGTSALADTPDRPAPAVFLGLLLTIGLTTMAADFARRRLAVRIAPDKRILSRLVIGGVSLGILWLITRVLLLTSGEAGPANSFLCAGLPLVVLDWRRLAAPGRQRRISLMPVLVSAAIAAVVPVFPQKEWLLAGGLAAGIALTLQVISAFDPRWATGGICVAGTDDERAHAADAYELAADAAPGAVRVDEAAAAGLPEAGGAEVSPHSRWVLLALASIYFVVPIGGLHRFLVGKTGSGVVWLATGGMFVIGQIIDLVSIVTGNFEDAEGRRVLAWENPPPSSRAATPVNHLSAVPGEGSDPAIRRGRVFSKVLAGLGTILLVLSLLIAMGASIFGMVASVIGSDLDFARSIVEKVTLIIGPSLAMGGIGLLLVARREDGIGHMLRAVAGGLGIMTAVSAAIVLSGRWFRFYEGATAVWPLLVLGMAAMLALLISMLILAWPARRRPSDRRLPADKGVQSW
jgi:hypothetical protein